MKKKPNKSESNAAQEQKKVLEVAAITCPGCGDTIYSRANHDFHSCSCGGYSIDGGFEYLRFAWQPPLPPPKAHKIKVSATKAELYEDWNKNKNKYGTIKNKTSKS